MEARSTFRLPREPKHFLNSMAQVAACVIYQREHNRFTVLNIKYIHTNIFQQIVQVCLSFHFCFSNPINQKYDLQNFDRKSLTGLLRIDLVNWGKAVYFQYLDNYNTQVHSKGCGPVF